MQNVFLLRELKVKKKKINGENKLRFKLKCKTKKIEKL